MRTSLVRAAAPLRSSSLRPHPNNLIHRPYVQQTLPPPYMPVTQPIKSFSTQHPLRSQNPSPSPASSGPPLPPNPSFGAASFKELGATQTVKIVVYIAVSIIATVETFTWSKFLWAKFGPEKVVEHEDVEK
ncbi:hypothetical protein BKA65DRAFT_258574 [Rhexocercosporidium sp. MPI-PUGE-AT-0058]|nr:hypothetical protein BKA65DRAFT_258574 [Rhexocercosporidium sp. MPI-PUGE-AT-0058]